MVTADGRIKVLDFGLAKLRENDEPIASMRMMKRRGARQRSRSTRRCRRNRIPISSATQPPRTPTSYETHAGTLLGTPLYMAPEQIAGALPDERSEVFSVGVLAYELVAGKPPYTALTMDALFEQILKDRARRSTTCPAGRAIVARALAKEPEERYRVDGGAARRDRGVAQRPPAKRWPFVAAVAAVVAGRGARGRAVAASRGRPCDRATST